jgi:hypothetical protein
MTHYAKLAAIGFRLVAVAGFLYFLPGLITVLRVARMTDFSHQMPVLMIVSVFLHPVIAAMLFFCSRPLGNFVAQGFE